MPPSHSAPEAPTHLRAGDLPPGLLDHLLPARAGSIHSSSAANTQRRGEPERLPSVPHYHDDEHSIVAVNRDSSRLISHSHSHSISRSLIEAAPRVPPEPGSVVTPPGRPRRMPRPGTHRAEEPAPYTSTPHATPHSTPHAGTPQATRGSAPELAPHTSSAHGSGPHPMPHTGSARGSAPHPAQAG